MYLKYLLSGLSALGMHYDWSILTVYVNTYACAESNKHGEPVKSSYTAHFAGVILIPFRQDKQFHRSVRRSGRTDVSYTLSFSLFPQTASSLSSSSDLVRGVYARASESGEAARREKRGRCLSSLALSVTRVAIFVIHS